MSAESNIEWTEATWNPVRGCTKVSPGCKHCYAETFAERWRGIPGHAYEQGFDLRLVPEALYLPLRWKKPKTIFVNSMSDLFHEGIPEDYIRGVFEVMERAHWHTFQVLTKRGARLAELAPRLSWPKNVWMGVSVEDRKYGMPRVEHLKKVPAAVRFLSIEPLLDEINIRPHLLGFDVANPGACANCGQGHGFTRCPNYGQISPTIIPGPGWPAGTKSCTQFRPSYQQPIGWVIIGGESGPGARPMAQEWAAAIVRQCKAASVPVFVKQMGSVWARQNNSRTQKGSDLNEWPEVLRVREMPR